MAPLISRRAWFGVAAAATCAAASPGRTLLARAAVVAEPDAVGLLYDSTRCVGCGGCVAACKESNGLPWDGQPSELDCTTKNVVKTRHLRQPSAAGAATAFVKRQCMHCVDPSCVSACMLGALHKQGQSKRVAGEPQGTGIVAWDPELCLGCRYCEIACAFSIPKFEWLSANPRIVKCELCRHRADPAQGGPRAVANPACAEVCPTEAVIFGRRADLLVEARRRISAEPGRYAPRVYGESEGGGTQALYLTAAGVSFQDLGLPQLPSESPASLSETVSHAPYLHGLTPIALYAAAAVIMRNRKRAEEKSADRGEESK